MRTNIIENTEFPVVLCYLPLLSRAMKSFFGSFVRCWCLMKLKAVAINVEIANLFRSWEMQKGLLQLLFQLWYSEILCQLWVCWGMHLLSLEWLCTVKRRRGADEGLDFSFKWFCFCCWIRGIKEIVWRLKGFNIWGLLMSPIWLMILLTKICCLFGRDSVVAAGEISVEGFM